LLFVIAHVHIEEVRMSAPSQADGVRALAEPLAREAGLVVESVTVTPAGKRRVLRVVVDLPEDRTGGVPMEAVSVAAQSISAALDESSVMGGQPYVLEVSSPGTDRPLVERRHWLRARGRLVEITPASGHAGQGGTGRLTAVTEAGVVLDSVREVGWESIGSGRIEVEFGHPADFEDLDDVDDDDENDDELDGDEAEFDAELENDFAAALGDDEVTKTEGEG
jgi:ribosome maturation factor RimP